MSAQPTSPGASPPPATPRPVLPHNVPEWINAVTGVGVLLLGVVTYWNTVRISGVEDYFRSELTVRNQQIVAASDELRGLQERSEELRDELAETSMAVETARTERDALATQAAALQLRGQQLSSDNSQLSEQSATLGKEIAMRDFSNRLLSTIYLFLGEQRPQNQHSSNPGLEMLDALERGYEARPSDNQYTRAIFASLRERCAGAANTPVELGPFQTTQPSAAEYARRSIPPRLFLTPGARDEWQREWNAYSEAWGEQWRLHEEEQRRRFDTHSEARQRAWKQIYECAADIIGASHQEF